MINTKCFINEEGLNMERRFIRNDGRLFFLSIGLLSDY